MKSHLNYKKHKSYEYYFEQIELEHEHNPLVGEAFWETAKFIQSFGYSYMGAVTVTRAYEKTYDLNLYRRPRDNHHTSNGELIEREFGVTKKSNKGLYDKLMSFFYNRTVLKKWSVEKALKLMHDRYDHLLDKDFTEAPETEQIVIPLSGRALYQERLKTCKDCDIEF